MHPTFYLREQQQCCGIPLKQSNLGEIREYLSWLTVEFIKSIKGV